MVSFVSYFIPTTLIEIFCHISLVWCCLQQRRLPVEINIYKIYFTGECPSGWINGGSIGGCYLFSQSDTGVTYNEAISICESNGGFLTDILNQETQNLLVNFATSQNYQNRIWYLGANNFANGQFVWISGNSFTYNNWFTGEPNRSGNSCIGVIGPPVYSYQWFDGPCIGRTFTEGTKIRIWGEGFFTL